MSFVSDLLSSVSNWFNDKSQSIKEEQKFSKKWMSSIGQVSLAFLVSGVILTKSYNYYRHFAHLREIKNSPYQPKIVIIGAGMSGLCLAIKLKTVLNYHNFVIYERDFDIGGTWKVNDYPGCCCDVPGVSYCFSFEPNLEWAMDYYPPRLEQLEYMQSLFKKHDLYKHIKFNSCITGMQYDNDKQIWNIDILKKTKTTQMRESDTAHIVVSGVGILTEKKVPHFEGIEKFKGKAFHSSEWDHSYDFENKNVGVIGTGPTGIQAIPGLSRMNVNKLYIFQRSLSHLVPKPVCSELARSIWSTVFKWVPGVYTISRAKSYFNWDHGFGPMIRTGSKKAQMFKEVCKEYREAMLSDRPDILEKITPKCEPFAKRVLISSEYFDMLKQDNVEMICDSIQRFVDNGIVTMNEKTEQKLTELDCLVYCTGFRSQEFLCSIPDGVIGKNGMSLQKDVWESDDCFAYYGITVTGFPNLFMLYGPGTNLGTNSVVFMIDCAADYTIQCIEKMIKNGWTEMDIKKDVMTDYVKRLDAANALNAWSQKGVTNWYRNYKGRGSTNWGWPSTMKYFRETETPNFDEYNIRSM